MDEFLRCAGPFDDDDDFTFDEGHAELGAEIREYADEIDDKFDDDDAVVVSPQPAKAAPAKKPTAKKIAPKTTPKKK